MKCETVREMLALWAGKDLDPDDLQAVDEHLAGCADCQELATTWREDLAGLSSELTGDGDAGPDAETLNAAVSAAVSHRASLRRRQRMSVGRSLAAVAALLVFMVAGRFWLEAPTVVAPLPPVAGERTVAWSELQNFFDDCLTMPVPVAQWRAEPEAGVLAVLVRTVERGQYRIVASLEAPDLARLRSYPWLAQRLEKLEAEAGEDGHLVVTTCGTGRLDRASRRRLQREFQAEFSDLSGN